MNEIIEKRKSVRKYKHGPLSGDMMKAIQEKIQEVVPLFDHIDYRVELVETFGDKKEAPYHLLFCGEEQEKSLENIGFIGQQISLYLSEIGLGSCWKMKKPAVQPSGSLPVVISMAFGLPAEELYRKQEDFKRKKLSEIAEGSDSRLEAARLAPSGLNAQDWYFIVENGQIHCYRKKPNLLTGFVKNKLNPIDIGIALCHIAEESNGFQYGTQVPHPEKKGFLYMGTAK